MRSIMPGVCRTRFRSNDTLKLVALLLAVLPVEEDDNGCQAEVDFNELYELIWSHSEFLMGMSSDGESTTKGMYLLSLLY